LDALTKAPFSTSRALAIAVVILSDASCDCNGIISIRKDFVENLKVENGKVVANSLAD